MNNDIIIYAVEDEEVSQIILKNIFEDIYRIEIFDNAEECLSKIDDVKPDLILLDIQLPKMNGYELCKQIRDNYSTKDIPVIFISSFDNLENRLKSYECGGTDFIIKPYAIEELKYKIDTIISNIESKKSLNNQASDHEKLAMALLSNMDEYAYLIQFMRLLNETEEFEEVANGLLKMLKGLSLDGAIQIRNKEQFMTISNKGKDLPLENSIISHVKNLGRIFEFKKCGVYNFEYITVLVNNMPLNDLELCGRIRDHLAIAAEMADAKIKSLISEKKLKNAQENINDLVSEVKQTIQLYIARQKTIQNQSNFKTKELIDNLIISLSHLGLSREHEEEIQNHILQKSQDFVAIYDNGEESTLTLIEVCNKLEKIMD